MISSPGIGSGLDINGIINSLMAAERQPLNALVAREKDYQAQLSAFGKVNSALSTFQAAVQKLSSSDKFLAQSATPSDSSLFTASTGASAVAGSYSIEVSKLAQQHKLATAGFANTTDSLGSGTLTIQFGTYDSDANEFTQNPNKASGTITIDSSNNSLAGIRDAINAAGIGVTASIINDGSANGNRLVLTSTDSGAANSIKISVSDIDGFPLDNSGLSMLAYDPTAVLDSGKNMSQVAEARDALLRIDGIDIRQSSNTIKDAIQGVTLNLVKTNEGQPATLSIGRDSTSIKDAVQSFVDAYNEASKTLKDLTAYNAETKQGAVLQGDATMRTIQSKMRSLLNTAVGTSGALTTLSQVGVSFQRDGTLVLNDSKLQTAIDSNFEDIGALFASTARATDSLVSFTGNTAKTQAGNYAVTINQLATRGLLQGSQAANLAISAGVNDQVDLTIDGIAVSITLTAGNYASASALAAEVQSRINSAKELSDVGTSVVVSQSGGILSITSNRYGSASSVSIDGGNGAADLAGAGATSTNGVNVAGTINGVAATGSGQILTGAFGDASEGLALKIIGGNLGSRGTVNFTHGYAAQFNQYLDSLLGTDSSLSARTDGINASIKSLDRRQEAMEARLAQIEKRYRAQFTALDTMLTSMTATSTYLTQQLASLQNLNKQ